MPALQASASFPFLVVWFSTASVKTTNASKEGKGENNMNLSTLICAEAGIALSMLIAIVAIVRWEELP